MGLKKKLFELKSNKGVMKYLSNTSWLLGEKVLRMTVGLFVGIWVTRYLGPEQFGVFSYAQSFVALFSVFSTLGLSSIVIRDLVQDESRGPVYMGTVFILQLLGSLIIFLLLNLILMNQGEDSNTTRLIFIIASATFFQSFNVIDFYFQSKVLSKYVVYSNVIVLGLSSIIKILLIINEAPLISFAYVILFDSIILAFGLIYFYFRSKFNIFSWSFNLVLAKKLLLESWPLIFSGFVISMYMKIDQIMIKNMLGVSEVGQYAAAVRLSEAWYFIPMMISASLFPAIINAKAKSQKLYYSRLQKLYDLMVCISILIAIPMTFLSDWLVRLLYGAEFIGAAPVLMIHIWASIFVFLGVASGKWFVSEGLQIYSLYRTLAGGLLNVVLNFILIPTYGTIGAAIATLVSQIVASYLFNVISEKTRGTFILQSKALFSPVRLKGFKK